MSVPTIPQSAENFGLFEALIGRRSRRFGLGMDIPDGPLAFSSPHEPVPLSDDERALLAFASLGVTGFNLGIPHTASGTPEEGSNYVHRFVGRTTPSGAGIEASEVLITDDTGTYISQTRNLPPEKIAEIGQSQTLAEYVGHARDNLVKLGDEPIRLPGALPFIVKHNWWTSLQPGTTLVVPVLDATEGALTLLGMQSGQGALFWDHVNNVPLGKPEKLIRDGLINEEAKVPYAYLEQQLYFKANQEMALIPYNAQLALQAMGLGGWLYGGINGDALLGALAHEGLPGFGFTFSEGTFAGLPNPVGLDGYFETLAPPYVSSAREAVEKFVDRKFGPEGIYVAGDGPYRDQRGITSKAQRYTDDQIEYFISVVEDVTERYGRFPGTGPTVLTGLYTQATHVDLDYYEKFHHEDAILDTHRNHFHDWHGGEQPKRRA